MKKNAMIKPFFNKSFFILFTTLVASIIVLFLILFFTTERIVVSQVFFGAFALLLFPFLYQWFNFKSLNKKFSTNKYVSRKDHKHLIDRFYVNAEHNYQNYRHALTRSVYWTIAVLLVPQILNITLAIVFVIIR